MVGRNFDMYVIPKSRRVIVTDELCRSTVVIGEGIDNSNDLVDSAQSERLRISGKLFCVYVRPSNLGHPAWSVERSDRVSPAAMVLSLHTLTPSQSGAGIVLTQGGVGTLRSRRMHLMLDRVAHNCAACTSGQRSADGRRNIALCYPTWYTATSDLSYARNG